MVAFFFPGLKDSADPEKILAGVKQFAQETLGWSVTERRIRRLSYKWNGRTLTAEVGKDDEVDHELIVAILETAQCYLIVTPNRGFLRGQPILAGKHDTYSVEDFDPTSDVMTR